MPCPWVVLKGWIAFPRLPCLEQACLDEAGQRFTQASTAPFLTPPLVNIFGKTRFWSLAFNQVLEGTFVALPNCDSNALKVLQALSRPQQAMPCTLQSATEYGKGMARHF